MPMYLPSGRGGAVDFEGGGDAHVLDLDTAVKDGILGGGGGGFAAPVEFLEKMDLKKVIRELNLSEIPTVFICPISLEPMQDPVTLCTGQTYERSNILKWFSLGHCTCPTTMQELWDYTVTPNKTLHHLICSWFLQKHQQMKKKSEDVSGRAMEILETLKKVKGQSRLQSLKDLQQVVSSHATSRKTVVDEGGAPLLSSLLGPFTSHAVGSTVVAILVHLSLDSESRKNLMEPSKISLLVDMLNEGSTETKINCTRLIKLLMEGSDFRIEIVSSHSLLVALMRLVRDKRNPSVHLHGLRLLGLICSHEQVKTLVIRIGVIPQLVELLPGMKPDCLEIALFVLDALSSVPEGRLGLKDCPNGIRTMVKLLMKVSERCTQHALSILWSVCKVGFEECSVVAVEAGLPTKLLLVIQSGCSPVLKQRASELLKLCSLNYSDTMFISKCRLNRTIH
ncbi:unnamed protein product [Cuscuta epithymum]|uniref:U-box domain-containing protein n=1 Tax=Cuscuta epithymum TaxID=186058 RepID=A0AAV0DZ21_9ASTE|nr:unnamed protein product [Cuscuta epithymum]CAH9118993.1 unnamed protein product [Cuscuta epithymum]